MQRPPQLPSILSARQSYQWINRVNQKFQTLVGLTPAPEQKQSLQDWLAREFVHSTLRLEGFALSLEWIAQAVDATPVQANSAELRRADETLIALREVEKVIAEEGQKARLSVALLNRLHQGAGFRKSDSSASRVRAEHLPLIVENACRWFAMDSFAELNPVEQAAIALLRLLEIAPFEAHNQRTAVIAASLFTLRTGLPPLIVQAEQREAYQAALGEGAHMNTQPMVELLARSVEQTLDEMIKRLQA
jgi:Fic family protein